MYNIVFFIILGAFFLWLAYEIIVDPVRVSEKTDECTCGQEERWCVSKTYYFSSSQGLRIKREPEELFKCGKVKKDLKMMEDIWKNR